jgi:hypothetical protein
LNRRNAAREAELTAPFLDLDQRAQMGDAEGRENAAVPPVARQL